MTIFFTGYIAIAVILLVTVNFMLRRQDKRNKSVNETAPGKREEAVQRQKSSASPDMIEMAKTATPAEEQNILSEEISEDLPGTEAEPVVPEHAEPIHQSFSRTETAEDEAAERAGMIQPSDSPGKAVKPGKAPRPAINMLDIQSKRGRIVFTMMLGAFVAILNQTLLNVAIPHIMNDFGVSASTVQWLSTGYMLTNGIFIPITAFLIARLGTRKLFIISIFAFTVGSIICSVSGTFSMLMTGRVIQAAGAGIIMPLLMTVFLTIYPPEKRGAAMGMFGVAVMFAPALGPTLSGWLIGHYSWRVLFYIVIPFGVLAIVMAFIWMMDVTKITKPKFDVFGFIFSTIGLGFLLYGFSEAGNNGWDSAIVTVTLIVGTIGLIAFIIRELTTDEPMLDLRVFKFSIFTLTTIIASIINIVMFAAMLLLPIYLQNIRGFTALDSGLLMLPGAIAMAIMMPISGRLFDKMGARWLAVFGLLITVITTWQFSTLTMTTSYGFLLFLYVMRMFGMSFLSMTVTTEGMNQLPKRLAGHGTSASNTARTVAGSIGTAFLITVMTTRTSFHAQGYANNITTDNGFLADKLHGLGQSIAGMTGLPSQAGDTLATAQVYGEVMKNASIQGINDAFIVSTGIAVVAFLLAFFIKRAKPPVEDE